MIDRLRSETRDLHHAIERDLDLNCYLASRAAYRALLTGWWGFLAAFEPAVAAMLEPAFHAPRRKLHLLRQDLQALGLAAATIDRLPICESFPPPASEAEALGALYVIEGSTLGGQLIARRAIDLLGPDVPLAFLRPYGPAVGAMWRAFRMHLLDRVALQAEDIAIASARATFVQLSSWFQAHQRISDALK